ncbi:hypothetical protein [Pseudodesulfovibrio methanolicus]|uniref:Uncharacterized protein n=1 Tax=Pseudodesulfovibrio methanolicus TaxID=3126690 RepID=A0ABZ2ISK0_9BACT
MERSEFYEERSKRLAAGMTNWGAASPVKVQAAKESADGHFCYVKTKAGMFGEAVSYCFEADDGWFWVGNYEYESAVEFCPFCGAQSRP